MKHEDDWDGSWSPDRYLTLDHAQVRYRRRSGRSQAGVPLVLVNGIGAAMEMWADFLVGMDDREIIAFDLPGAGRSTAAPLPVGMSWFAGQVAKILDALGVDVVDMLGFSFGGTVAQQFARDHPHRLRRLVLASTTPGLPSLPGDPLALLIALTPMRYLDRTLGAMLVPHMVGGRTYRDRRVLMHQLPLRQEQPPTWWGYLTQLWAIGTYAGSLDLKSITASTLVLHGDDDRLCPVINARWMASTLPNARYRELHGAGHLLLLDEPAKAGRYVREFLDEHEDGERDTHRPQATGVSTRSRTGRAQRPTAAADSPRSADSRRTA
ncbi:MAG: alpha/beta fold hydrolase [Actinomycetales bacterium]